MVRVLSAASVALMLALGALSPVKADAPEAINLNFPASDGMTVSDCLRVVAMETGEVVLPDASVDGSVGSIHVSKSSVPDILDVLKTFEPGLTWQIVYYPAGANEPSGEDIYKAISVLQGFDMEGLIVPPSGDDKIMYSFKKQLYTTPEQETANEAGFRKYYLVSDSDVRAQMDKLAKQAAAPPPPVTDKPGHFASTLSDLQNQIAQMNPQQQVQAYNQLTATAKQITQSLSPQAQGAIRPLVAAPKP